MFTGIIEEIGEITNIQKGAKSSVLTIKANIIFEDLKLGDSVAVNGVCLTASKITGGTFSADVMSETLARSSLGQLKAKSYVNLERAMALGGRLGGHIVSGHIDGIGTIASIKKDDNAIIFTIKTTEEITKYIIKKGSIAIDGISLTVVDVDFSSFSVSIIPHTAKFTTLATSSIGKIVNLENDMIGKYIEKLLGISSRDTTISKNNINLDFLKNHGF